MIHNNYNDDIKTLSGVVQPTYCTANWPKLTHRHSKRSLWELPLNSSLLSHTEPRNSSATNPDSWNHFCWLKVLTDRGKETWMTAVFCWLLTVPETYNSILVTNLLKHLYMLPHWDRSCRSNFLSHHVTACQHQANQPQCWPITTGA